MTNPGTDLHPDWFEGIRINTPAVERRAASMKRTSRWPWAFSTVPVLSEAQKIAAEGGISVRRL